MIDGRPRAVLLIDCGPAPAGWPRDLVDAIAAEGLTIVRVHDLTVALLRAQTGDATAILVDARQLDVGGSITLEKVRRAAPSIAVVAVSTAPATASIPRALESGATAFLPWPSPIGLLRSALGSGGSGS